MKAVYAILIVSFAAAALAFAVTRLEKRPGYGYYYGLARLTGSRLDR
jgi:hypothetical protein